MVVGVVFPDPRQYMARKIRMPTRPCLLHYLIYFLTVPLTTGVGGASIPWSVRTGDSSSGFSGVWYFQAGRNGRGNDETKFFASDTLPSSSTKCDEPKNLPQQFMEWFRESTSDPAILALTLAGGNADRSTSNPQSLNALTVEPESCSNTPSTDPDASTMERALCPWEWRLNRDEGREPKLISEAKCLCRRSRGSGTMADCLPIQREFPVLRRIYCDEHGNYQYVKSYETITVGCHSVMPRVSRAVPWQPRPKEV